MLRFFSLQLHEGCMLTRKNKVGEFTQLETLERPRRILQNRVSECSRQRLLHSAAIQQPDCLQCQRWRLLTSTDMHVVKKRVENEDIPRLVPHPTPISAVLRSGRCKRRLTSPLRTALEAPCRAVNWRLPVVSASRKPGITSRDNHNGNVRNGQPHYYVP